MSGRGLMVPGGDPLGVARDRHHVVRRLTAQAGFELHFGDDRRAVRGQAGPLQRLAAVGSQALERDPHAGLDHCPVRRCAALLAGAAATAPVRRSSGAARAAWASVAARPHARDRSSAWRGSSRRRGRRSCRRGRRDHAEHVRPDRRQRLLDPEAGTTSSARVQRAHRHRREPAPSASRSTLPLGVRGSAGSSTIRDGTM